MDYILSPCSYAAEGLARVMMDDCQHPIQLNSKSLDSLVLSSPVSARRLVVFLPNDLFFLLKTLQQTAFLLKRTIKPLPTIILNSCPSYWLWKTLANLVINRSLLSEIRSIPSELPFRCVADQLRNKDLLGGGLLIEQAKKEKMIYNCSGSGLSKAELNAILDWILGYNILSRSKQLGISPKTIYNHRKAGVKKISMHYPELSVHFPGNVEAKKIW